MEHGGINGYPGMDDWALMELAGAVIAQAAMDYMQGYITRLVSGELPALDFLQAAGLVERVPDIVRHSPMLNGRKRNNTEARRVAA